MASTAAAAVLRAAVPRRGRDLLLDDRRVRVIETGNPDGAPVVMIHGLGGQADNFSRMLPYLDDFRCLAVDRAGAGRSEPAPPRAEGLAAQAARIAAVMEARGTGPAVIVGHSLGTAVALQLAADRPDLVAGLVTVGGLTRPAHRHLARIAALFGRAVPLREGFAHTAAVPLLVLLSRRLIGLCFGPEPMPAGFLRWGGGFLAAQPRAISGMLRDLDVMARGIGALQPRLGALRCPVAVLHGRGDRILPVAQAVHLAARLPQAELLTPEGGHMLVVTQPELVAEAVRRTWRAAHQGA